MASDPELRAHQDWIGMVQPIGLVVSATALVEAGVFVNQNVIGEQQALLRLVRKETVRGNGAAVPEEREYVADLSALCTEVLRWRPEDLAPAPPGLEVPLPNYGETLTPTFAVPNDWQGQPAGATPSTWRLLVQVLPRGTDFDHPGKLDERQWQAGPQARLERLLRETKVPIGILFNETALRLVYAPSGESSGHATFRVHDMAGVMGRPILSALVMLLGTDTLFSQVPGKTLAALLHASRKYQNTVSTALAGQVLAALNHLLRGLQAANDAREGRLLQDLLREAPEEVYGGLLTTLLRLVFLLYAEDRGLMPSDPVYGQHYSVTGLFGQLRDDASRHPDTMDKRYGAWARLLALFRIVHDGGGHGEMRFPPRYGRLFDPDAYPFLEGRPHGDRRVMGDRVDPPAIADGAIWRVLENLLLLDGDRISYRTLDVEQIGSVYEALMGFSLEVAKGPSIALRPDHVVVDLKKLVALPPAERARSLKKDAACEVTGKALEALKKAKTVDEAAEALAARVSTRVKYRIPTEGMYLQPTEERRRSGSHYTPRSLTKPIVERTLVPVLEALGPKPTPEQILDVKVCDPAMGSGAFLVEACRLLGLRLVEAWRAHRCTSKLAPPEPAIPLDQDPELYARRLVAQRCLYGVDKNPFAVDLARLSLWLVTLAKEHAFTFLDHALREGDSLVGLTRRQIVNFHWEETSKGVLAQGVIDRAVKKADELRAQIHGMADSDDTARKRELLGEADAALEQVRLAGNLVVAAFLGAEGKAKRNALRLSYAEEVHRAMEGVKGNREVKGIWDEFDAVGARIHPFHWEIEFPEVFLRENPGFDAIVGNPPFAGKNTISAGHREQYLPYLLVIHAESHGNADLVAHFFRRAFGLLRKDGTFGLIATKTIAQGDTRATGLRWIRKHGGVIYAARKRIKWPGGEAAVVVSVVHVKKGEANGPFDLDGRDVERITAFLFHAGGDDDPMPLRENAGKSFIGSYVLGMGFTFDDDNPEATPIEQMKRLIAKDPRNQERIFPYIGGEEVNDSPTHAHRRYVINYGEMTEAEARKWPDLMRIVEEKVKPSRLEDNRAGYRRYWWQFAEKRVELYAAIRGLSRVLGIARISNSYALTMLPAGTVLNEKIVVFASGAFGLLSMLQARPHETWARMFSTTLKDDLQYTPTDCFETFPFPRGWESSKALEAAGRAYYEHRAALMVKNNQGLTTTYNRFHDRNEDDAGIVRLRELHDAMDRAVLDAYGWKDLHPRCDYYLDYEEEEDAEAPSKKRKPWRYRWPDETRDDVLARLLALNAERADEERRQDPPLPKKPRGPTLFQTRGTSGGRRTMSSLARSRCTSFEPFSSRRYSPYASCGIT